MSRIINMKEVERIINDFWRVKGRYYTTVKEATDYKGVVFSIYDADTSEVILDLNVSYNKCIDELLMKLHEEIRNTYDINYIDLGKTKFNYSLIKYNRVQDFCYEWLEILEMISEYIKSSYYLLDDSCN